MDMKHRINRNIVECKGSSLCCSIRIMVVLIETLWNVKKEKPSPENEPEEVLIETLWNVKKGVFKWDLYRNVVLIETLWNVKLYRCRFPLWRADVLIETLWNVKTDINVAARAEELY